MGGSVSPRTEVFDQCPQGRRGVPPLRVVEVDPRVAFRELAENLHQIAAFHVVDLRFVGKGQPDAGPRQAKVEPGFVGKDA